MKKIDSAIFDFAYENAMRDATLMQAYSGNKKQLKNCTEAREIVWSYIDRILKGNEEGSVKDVINHTAEAFAGYPSFTFGNAQKLVNMTAKYMYMATYCNEDMRSKFTLDNCDCPMDRIIIDFVAKELKDSNLMDLKGFNGELYDELKDYYFKTYIKNLEGYDDLFDSENELDIESEVNLKPFTWHGPSWSKIDKDHTEPYDYFQKAVRFLMEAKYHECKDPIAFDFICWNASRKAEMEK